MDIRNFFGKPSQSKKKRKTSNTAVANGEDKATVVAAETSATTNNNAAAPVTSQDTKINKSNGNSTLVKQKSTESTSKHDEKERKVNDQTKSRTTKDDVTKVIVKETPVIKKSEGNFNTKDDDNDNDDDDYIDEKEECQDDGDNDDITQSTPPRKKKEISTPSTKSNTKKRKTHVTPSSSTTPKKKKLPKKKKEKILVKPTKILSNYPAENVRNSQLFMDITFVITGVLSTISRDDLSDYVKILGGRVTTGVSSKTNYLVIGHQLEDGRDVEAGSKYRKAMELGESSITILNGEEEVYALAEMLDDDNNDPNMSGDSDNAVHVTTSINNEEVERSLTANSYARKPELSNVTNPYANKSSTNASTSNPYVKKTESGNGGGVANPYAKKSAVVNPYAKKSSVSNPYAKSSNLSSSSNDASSALKAYQNNPMKIESSSNGGGRASINDPNALWADKYAPNISTKIIGNGDAVKKLKTWLSNWENNFLKPLPKGKKRPFNPKFGPFKAALLSGPPGIGKTTTAVLVAKESNRQYLELNASDTRSKKSLETNLGDVTGSQVLSFGNPKAGTLKQQRCIIMDEVDGMGAGDRSGMSELIKMIKNSMVPIICICNDRQNQKIKSLAPHCLDLKYRRPVKSVIARRAVEVGKAEGMNIEYNAAEAVAESCGNDIRQVLNCLQMWSNKRHDSLDNKADMTYKDYKNRDNLVKKDEILRVSLFDATRMIIEGRKGISSEADATVQRNDLYKRTDAFFVDYSLMGLMVHQNYLKVVNGRFLKTKSDGDLQSELDCVKEMCSGTECMSDFAFAEESVRRGQNWGLLPLCSVLAVKSGYHAGGESGGFLPGFPEFSGWLGKNSSRGKKTRMIQELSHHMNYKISADNTELRLAYLPAMRSYLANLLITKDEVRVNEAIEFMDEYGLDRDDIFENIDEFVMEKCKKFADLDSKVKAAFTREYNKGSHKSQALVDEQGVTTTKKRKASSTEDDLGEIDGKGEASESDEEINVEELKKMFQKKKPKSKKTPAKRGKKAKK